MLKEKYVLSNGVEIPKIGLGTWLIENDRVSDAVSEAIKIGYRHIDTAQAYGNEEGVGQGIKTCGVPREELFITTKVAAEIKSYEEAKASIDESLKKLDVDYIDLVIIHCPQPWSEFRGAKRYFKENIEVWKALEEAYKEGKVKSIGVSNFLIDDLENILNSCEIKPMVNQIHVHIANTPFELIDFCNKNDILVEAYSPIAHGDAVKSKKLKEMADKYNVSVAQLCIRYTLELGLVTLPKTVNKEHMMMNADVDFKISDEDMENLKKLKKIID